MKYAKNVFELVGNTPLIYLKKASEMTGCTILGKAEFMNPSGSIKDRAAKGMLLDAIKHNKISKGGIVVEGTAGNTGIGLTLLGNQLGLKTKIVMNNNQTDEKKNALRMMGAELFEVEPKPYSDEGNYIRYAGALSEKIAATNPEGGVFWANQFENLANRNAHRDGTAQEIWRDTDGKIDGFVCAVGSGGTLAGTAEGLRQNNENIKIALAEPPGAKLYSYYTTGELAGEGSSITEGIGQVRLVGTLQGLSVDMAYRIDDTESLPWVFHMLQHEGLCLGSSAGVNIAGAVEMAKQMGKGKVIVTLLCDEGTRYRTKLFNPEFLRSKNLPVPQWLDNVPEWLDV